MIVQEMGKLFLPFLLRRVFLFGSISEIACELKTGKICFIIDEDETRYKTVELRRA